jgi:15-cis-phytoene synthase
VSAERALPARRSALGAELRVAPGSPLGSDAIALCRQTIAVHSKSFALASRVLPPRCRDEAAVVYTWCRRADDAVDLAPPGRQAAALVRLGIELDGIYDAQSHAQSQDQPQADIALAAFREVVQRHRIPREYPAELLAGMDMDVRGQRYDDMHTLLLYCYRVASTVGLMMSHVMGVTHDGALRHAAHLGMAMQLTNICRDVLEDWEMGRLYIPTELLAEHGIGDLGRALGGPFPERARAPMRGAVARLLGEARQFYRSGDRGLAALPWRCAFGVRAARLVYAAIGERIARSDFDVLAGRAVVPTWHKLLLVGRAGASALAEVPARLVRVLGRGPRPRIPRDHARFPHGVLPL